LVGHPYPHPRDANPEPAQLPGVGVGSMRRAVTADPIQPPLGFV